MKNYDAKKLIRSLKIRFVFFLSWTFFIISFILIGLLIMIFLAFFVKEKQKDSNQFQNAIIYGLWIYIGLILFNMFVYFLSNKLINKQISKSPELNKLFPENIELLKNPFVLFKKSGY